MDAQRRTFSRFGDYLGELKGKPGGDPTGPAGATHATPRPGFVLINNKYSQTHRRRPSKRSFCAKLLTCCYFVSILIGLTR